MRNRKIVILAAAAVFLLGCAASFLADFDPAVATGTVELQQKVGTFLTFLARHGRSPEGAYERHRGFYDGIRAELGTLRTAALVRNGNSLTVESLDLIAENVDDLEKLHREGLSERELSVIQILFDTQFRMLIDLENAKKRQGGGA
jgi:hypothetical protein